MALDEFEDDYRKRVKDEFETGGIAGPMDGGFPAPAASPKPTGTYDRDKFVTGWRDSSFAPTEQGFRDYLGQSQFGAGVQYTGGDKFTDPTGRMFDVIGDFGTGGAKKRTGYTTDKRFADVTGSGKGKGKVSTTGAPGAGAGATGANSFTSSIRDLIMEQLNGLKGTPSIDDPALAAQSNAYSRQSQRGVADQRAMLAERAAANGLLQGGQSSGGFDTAVQGVMENAAEDRAGHDARLVGNEIQQRRATMQGLLNMALASGDAESARALSLQLANLDAQLRREGMTQQNNQFNAGLNFDRYRYDDTMGWNQSRAGEDDYRWRVLFGLGA